MIADALPQLQAAAAAFQQGIWKANQLPDGFPTDEMAAVARQIEAISGLEDGDLKIAIHLRDKLLQSIEAYPSTEEAPSIDHLKRLHGELFIAVARYVTSVDATRIKAAEPKNQTGKLMAESADHQSAIQQILVGVQATLERTEAAKIVINQTINKNTFTLLQMTELKISLDGLRKAILGVNIELTAKFLDLAWLSEFMNWADKFRLNIRNICSSLSKDFFNSPVGGAVAGLLESASTIVIAVGRFIQKVARAAKFLKQYASETEANEGKTSTSLAAADAANRAKTEFLASMSHELRTPLNALIGFTDMLRGEIYGPVGDERYKAYLDDMAASSHHILGMVSDILDISKIELGNFTLEEETFSVDEMVGETVRMMRAHPAARDLRLEYSTYTENVRLYADRRQIARTLISLMSNALKFTPKGGNVSVVSSLESDNSIKITISDTGIGMSDADIKQATELSAKTHLTSYRGPGLGLPIASGIVAQHGGKLDFQSRAGHGTSVTLHLPEARVHH